MQYINYRYGVDSRCNQTYSQTFCDNSITSPVTIIKNTKMLSNILLWSQGGAHYSVTSELNYSMASGKLLSNFTCIIGLKGERFMGVSRVLQVCFPDVLRWFQGCFKNASKVLMKITRLGLNPLTLDSSSYALSIIL